MRGPTCDGWPIHDIIVDRATDALFAGGGSPWYGAAVFRSDDLGETWTHSSEGLTYGDDGPKVAKVWNVDGRARRPSTRASTRRGCSGARTAARPGSTSRA